MSRFWIRRVLESVNFALEPVSEWAILSRLRASKCTRLQFF